MRIAKQAAPMLPPTDKILICDMTISTVNLDLNCILEKPQITDSNREQAIALSIGNATEALNRAKQRPKYDQHTQTHMYVMRSWLAYLATTITK